MANRKHEAQPIVAGRRNCASCTRWRLVVDFKWRWRKRQVKKPQGGVYSSEVLGRTPWIDYICISCRRAEDRARYQNKKDVKVRRRNNAVSYHKARQAELAETRAENARLKEVNAQLTREITGTTGDDPYLLPIMPFRMWLLKRSRELGGLTRLADRLDTAAHRLEDYLNGYRWEDDGTYCDPVPIYSVKLQLVDRILMLDGTTTLSTLYPLKDE